MGTDSLRSKELKELQRILKYSFKDIGMLNTALTHSSYANEKGMLRNQYNERLEFLGDAVLQMITSEYLYNKYEEYPEGILTKMRASLVMGQALGAYSGSLGLGRFLRMGKGEETSGGRERESILANAFEAVIGSMYLDGGYSPVKAFVIRYIDERLLQLTYGDPTLDYKTALQESIQSSGDGAIQYRLISEQGPDHDKTFHVSVYIDNRSHGEGTGKSKKEAEQRAAKKALEQLGE